MNEQARPTAGPWRVTAEAPDEDGEPAYFAVSDAEGYEIANTANGNFPTPIEEAHAALIAEAGSVYHETNLTPRQLAEQRKELMEALAAVIDQCDGYVPNTSKAVWRAAQQALAHARGEQS